MLEIGICFTNHVYILPTKLDNAGVFLVREIWFWLGKCQGNLLSIICGNPACRVEAHFKVDFLVGEMEFCDLLFSKMAFIWVTGGGGVLNKN